MIHYSFLAAVANNTVCGISVTSGLKSVYLPVTDSILCLLFNCFVFLFHLSLICTVFFSDKF